MDKWTDTWRDGCRDELEGSMGRCRERWMDGEGI